MTRSYDYLGFRIYGRAQRVCHSWDRRSIGGTEVGNAERWASDGDVRIGRGLRSPKNLSEVETESFT